MDVFSWSDAPAAAHFLCLLPVIHTASARNLMHTFQTPGTLTGQHCPSPHLHPSLHSKPYGSSSKGTNLLIHQLLVCLQISTQLVENITLVISQMEKPLTDIAEPMKKGMNKTSELKFWFGLLWVLILGWWWQCLARAMWGREKTCSQRTAWGKDQTPKF